MKQLQQNFCLSTSMTKLFLERVENLEIIFYCGILTICKFYDSFLCFDSVGCQLALYNHYNFS